MRSGGNRKSRWSFRRNREEVGRYRFNSERYRFLRKEGIEGKIWRCKKEREFKKKDGNIRILIKRSGEERWKDNEGRRIDNEDEIWRIEKKDKKLKSDGCWKGRYRGNGEIYWRRLRKEGNKSKRDLRRKSEKDWWRRDRWWKRDFKIKEKKIEDEKKSRYRWCRKIGSIYYVRYLKRCERRNKFSWLRI